MPEYIGPIAIPEQAPVGTFPLTPNFGLVRTYAPEIVAQRFAHGDASAEQRFYVGDGLIRWTLPFPKLSPARAAALQQFFDEHFQEQVPFTLTLPMPDGTTSSVVARFDGPLKLQALSGGVYFSASVNLCEVPQTTPNYTPAQTLTRFPDTTTLTSLLTDTQELIPLVQIEPLGNMYAASGGTIAAATLRMLTSHLFGGAGNAFVIVGNPTGDAILTAPRVVDVPTDYTLRTDSYAIPSPSSDALSALEITCFDYGTVAADIDGVFHNISGPCQLLIYDCWIDVTYIDGSTVVWRPTTTGLNNLDDGSWGTISNVSNAFDGDPSTCAVIDRVKFRPLAAYDLCGLVLSEFAPASSPAPPIFISDRRCIIGGQLYQPRILDLSEITQSIDGAADQFSVTLGNADRVFSQLARAVTLYGATLTFSYFHVNSGTLLNLWSGEINDFQDDPTDKFILSAGDPVWNLRKNYPVLSVDRNDPQFQVPDQPVQVHSGGNRITSTSIASDTVYGQPIQDVWVNDSTHPLKVPCQILSGRDESQYYAALGIVSRGPIGSFYQLTDHDHTLDGLPWHGAGDSDASKRSYGLRRSYGGDPSTGNPASKDNSPDAGSNYFALDSTSTSWPQNGQPVDGVSFLEIRRTDASGIQPVAVNTHDMEAYIQEGLGGWVWTAPGTRTWVRGLTNPIWVAINTFLIWKSAQFVGSAPCAALPNPLPSNWSSGSGAPSSTPADGAVYIDTAGQIYYSRAGGVWQAMGDYAVNLAKLYWYANATATQMEAWFDCPKAIADAAICDIQVTPLFARTKNVNLPNISIPSSFPLPNNWTFGSGAPTAASALGAIYVDEATNYLYTYTSQGWGLVGVFKEVHGTEIPDIMDIIGSTVEYVTVSQAVTSEPQFSCAGVIGADSSGNPRPLRDVLRDILGSCLGFFNFCGGKLRTGLAYSASATDAFTIGNTLYNSYSESSRRPGFTRLEVTFSDSDYDYADNSLGYEDKDVLLIAGRSVKKARVWGVTTKSQAARITATKAREELGGHGPTAMMNARTHQLRSTVLALSMEPGAVCSYTGPKTGDTTVKFRCAKWSLNPKDFSLTIEGPTATDEMYDLTSGPKPADVAPSAIPGRSTAGLKPLPVLPIIVDGVTYPFLVTTTTDGTSIYLSGEYCPPLPIRNFVGVTMYVEIPTGSGRIVCAGDFDYTGNRDAVDDQLWGTFCGRFPLPATSTESWTVYLCSRTSLLRAPLDTTAPHMAVLSGANGVFAPPITSFSMSIEIEGTAAQGGGIFTPNADGSLTRTGDSAHALGAANIGVQSSRCTFQVGMPNDSAAQGIYIVHAFFTDGTYAVVKPATGSGWYGDGFGMIINGQPIKGAVWTCYSEWNVIPGYALYQEFSARTYNYSTPPVTTAPPAGMIQKLTLNAGYESQLFLVNGN